MVSYISFFVSFLLLGIICVSPGEANGFINDGNVHLVIQERAHQMQEIRNSVDIDEYIKQEMSKPVKGTGMTEIELIEKILSKKEEIISELDERSFATCLTDLGQYLTDLVGGKVYAWQMRKSYGDRFGLLTTLLTWRFEYLGIYEVCESVQADNPDAPFKTTYCTENLPVASGLPYYKRGICVPASCSKENLTALYSAAFAALGWENLVGTYVTCITDVPWEWDAIFVTCLLGFFGILVAVGTIYDTAYRRRRLAALVEASPVQNERPKEIGKHDVIQNVYNEEDGGKKHEESSFHHEGPSEDQSQQQLYMTSEEERELAMKESEKGTKLVDKDSHWHAEGRLGNLLTSFSVVYNCDKILSAKKNSSSLSCLNGIRVLSMFWVIWGHSNQFPFATRLGELLHQRN
ncbi:hypothetical protein HOLleu_39009 [Holothuria leucospilota]|uniref:Nose resistant-to-fluoxetine protein N-terminal domain-containing protein n=1 Tax=Holothuria leucospilota TaxID=206669 RepID=A0A9Q1BDU0_HOLLE|nr:hypothetical protein HOLleu_39009 [Holothuria leucospilota]